MRQHTICLQRLIKLLLLVTLKIALSALLLQSGKSFADEDEEEAERVKNHIVIVDPDFIETTETPGTTVGEYKLVSYTERRPVWGYTASVEYSSFEPVNFEPSFAAATYDEVYGSPDMPFLSLQFTVKRNTSIGSVGGQLAAGMFKVAGDSDIGSTLQLIPIRLGFVGYLDMLYKEPYVVPYADAGVYTIIYKEVLNSSSNNGNTQLAPYVGGGLAFQLDWIDKKNARIAYNDSGIESTYLFAETRMYFASGEKSDPDFSSDLNYGGGLRVEF